MTGADLAAAVFSIRDSRESKHVREVDDWLKTVPEYIRLLDCGALSAAQSDQMISQAFGNSLAASVCKLLARKRMMYLWPEFVSELKLLCDREKGILRVQVVSGVPLTPSLHKKLIQALERRTGKTVVLEEQVKPEVLGGISVQAQDLYWDGTLRGQLQQLRDTLKGGIS